MKIKFIYIKKIEEENLQINYNNLFETLNTFKIIKKKQLLFKKQKKT